MGRGLLALGAVEHEAEGVGIGRVGEGGAAAFLTFDDDPRIDAKN
jgi:hypothetical protein